MPLHLREIKDIKWETVEQGNIGVDLGFFKNSLTLSADAYIKTTRDMLMQNPLPGMAGYPTTPWVNAGSVETGVWNFDRVSREGWRLPLFCERKLYFPKK